MNTHPWPSVVETCREMARLTAGRPISEAHAASAAVAEHVQANYPTLFGFTSVGRLRICQTDDYADAPILQLDPQEDSTVLFIYVDTWNERRQWRRVASADKAIDRFERFLDVLHWVVRPRADSSHHGESG